MHDHKLSATLTGHQQLRMPDSIFGKMPINRYLQNNEHVNSNHFDEIRNQNYTALAQGAGSLPHIPALAEEEILHSGTRRFVLPLWYRFKDTGLSSEILNYSGSRSVCPDLAAEYRYSDLVHSKRQNELIQKYQVALSLAKMNALPQNFMENDYISEDSMQRLNEIIKRAAFVKSASTKHILPAPFLNPLAARKETMPMLSCQIPSSMSFSSHPTSCTHHHESAGLDSQWADPHNRQQIVQNPYLISSFKHPAGRTPLEDLVFRRDRTFPPAALTSSAPMPPSLWTSSLPISAFTQPSPHLKQASTTSCNPNKPPGSVGHLLGQYIHPSSIPSQHHLHNLNRHQFFTESLYNGSMFGSFVDSHISSGRELPTKSVKQHRIRDRQELSGVLHTDREHTERLARVHKSTITETHFSSLNSKSYPPYITIPEVITRDQLQTNYTSTQQSYPPSYYNLPPPPPLTQYFQTNVQHSSADFRPTSLPGQISKQQIQTLIHAPHIRPLYPSSLHNGVTPPHFLSHSQSLVNSDLQNTPLNLSISHTTPTSSINPPILPSPQMGHSETRRCASGSEKSANHKRPSNGLIRRQGISIEDETMDNHVRRGSLGKRSNESPTPKIVAIHFPDKLCSVDDHFARALGDQIWTEIKARSEPGPTEALSTLVDAHFSKALGDAKWKKLNTENKLPNDIRPEQEPQLLKTDEQESQVRTSPTSALQASLVT